MDPCDLAVLPHRPGGRPDRRPQGDRPRRRRRPGHDRPRHRRRLHLRQGDRVGHPPARDARGDHEHPVARLRPDRGDRLLRVHLRPDRLLPLGDDGLLLAAAEDSGGGSFLVSPSVGLMIWTLLAFGITLYLLNKLAFPRIAEALDKRRKAIEESIDAAQRSQAGGRRAARGVPRAAAEAREQAEDIVARARKAAESARATSRRRRPPSSARSCWRRRAATSSRDPPRARGDPQGGRRPHGARHREGHAQVARPRTTSAGSIEEALGEVDFSALAGTEGNGR